MAIHITNLDGGDITVGAGGGGIDPTKTRFTLQDGTVETYDITGTLNSQWMMNNVLVGRWRWNELDKDHNPS